MVPFYRCSRWWLASLYSRIVLLEAATVGPPSTACGGAGRDETVHAQARRIVITSSSTGGPTGRDKTDRHLRNTLFPVCEPGAKMSDKSCTLRTRKFLRNPLLGRRQFVRLHSYVPCIPVSVEIVELPLAVTSTGAMEPSQGNGGLLYVDTIPPTATQS